MTSEFLFLPILLPAVFGAAMFLIPARRKGLAGWLALFGTAALLAGCGYFLSVNAETTLNLPWLDGIVSFDLRLYSFNGFILFWIALTGFLVSLFSLIKVKALPRVREYYGYILLTLAAAGGSLLADNFVVFLFFWEGLLLTMYGLITLGAGNAPRTAVKAFLISAFCDFCLILGIAILWSVNGSPRMSGAGALPQGIAAAGFLLMVAGAIGKAGSMPFHTWIPDAAVDAPVGFMAFLPAALEKLLGIYLLARICLDFFALEPNSALSILLMAVGALTIVLAVMMALIQKDFKKLLSFHAISQVGYMILGIGTGTPIGIAGGLFHMLNNAIYKSGLFMSAGSIEHRTGTTEMKKLGGLGREMPATAAGFAVCALAISGIWPLNGFVSKEMVFHGALETGYAVFAVAAWVGAIFTFASFLKAGHAIFLGPRGTDVPAVKESESPIYLPILVLALVCVLFGVFNALPINAFIQPFVAGHLPAEEHLDLATHALDLFSPVALVSLGMLALGLLFHLTGWYRAGKKAYLASEILHNLPVLKTLYRWSEERVFDLYEQGLKVITTGSNFVFVVLDRPIDYFYDNILTGFGRRIIRAFRFLHNGYYPNYLAWCLAGLVVILILLRAF
jgi:formate hydrogenlyase subunit 3/multisubunit Na+/H+ antiporter MnhD subunit